MTSAALSCSICPKSPTFSDVSHMLTHVGSKGHLSHYFKAQVRSRQEPAVRQQLLEYDRWYKDLQVEKLLSERLLLKETKGGHSRRRAKAKDTAKIETAPSNPRIKREVSDEPSGRFHGAIDPQLSQSAFGPPMPFGASIHRSFGFHGTSQDASHLERWTPTGKTSGTRKDRGTAGRLALPKIAARLDDISPRGSPTGACGSPLPRHSPHRSASQASCSTGTGTETFDEAGESILPKGIIWPGMDLFDSASPEAQRMRNQKKTRCVTTRMEANSAQVEQTERIYWPNGELKQERLITGDIQSSSPLRALAPKPKTRRPSTRRPPLSTTSSNVSHAETLALASKANQRRRKTQAEPKKPDTVKPASHGYIPAPGPGFGARFHAIQEDYEVELRMTAGNQGSQDRQRFSVYEDVSSSRSSRPQGPRVEARRSSTIRNELYTQPSYAPTHVPDDACRARVAPMHRFGLPHTAAINGSSDDNPLARRPSSLAPKRAHHMLHHSDYNPFTGNPTETFEPGHDVLDSGKSVALAKVAHGLPENPLARTFLPRLFDNKENVEPIIDSAGRIDSAAPQVGMGRGTQRYFTTHADRQPSFSFAAPPFHDFATYHSTRSGCETLNPSVFSFEQSAPQPDYQASHLAKDVLPSKTENLSQDHRRDSRRAILGEDSGEETIDEEDGDCEMLFGADA